MTYVFTEAELADIAYPERGDRPCTCHSVREGSGGVSYSLAALGVACGYCESAEQEFDYIHEWNQLSRDERIARLTEVAQWREREAVKQAQREAEHARYVAEFGDEPPF